ncbi:MAG: hypothetical protein A3E83_01545 [Gammaproteobacteria bacterium RIFCSPHIGHO2_12_FULL_41_20]|nr:MAG: hypothetical protein A3E83_01545 [Gammaproteobacteria bacterium RIFCSPHIGHO2_12_FULL_41_20]
MASADNVYVLIHGAWHASWCWRYVVPLLELYGRVLAPDLPGHGKCFVDMRCIALSTYVDYVTNLVKAQDKPVVLVGHSLGGVIISQVAENIPECIKRLVYIAAFVPRNKQSLLYEASCSKSPGIAAELVLNEEENTLALLASPRICEIFYNCCCKKDVEFALSKLQVQPYRPLRDSISISSSRFGQVKKLYIECLQDVALAVEDQRRMHMKVHCDVVSLDTDHSPFFSAADELVKAIIL